MGRRWLAGFGIKWADLASHRLLLFGFIFLCGCAGLFTLTATATQAQGGSSVRRDEPRLQFVR